MRRKLALLVATSMAILAGAAYARWASAPLPEASIADSVLVLKGERRLVLLLKGTPLRSYHIALGRAPIGAKAEEGDSKTPEGRYTIDYHNYRSAYHLSLHISYPNDSDRLQAAWRGVNPGGAIMIHGAGAGMGLLLGRWHSLVDWTDGCIAVSNEEIEQIARAVPDGTPIEIRP